MPVIKKQGKDTIIFATKEDLASPSKVSLPEIEPSNPGLLLPNGEINWNCPCLGGMASGPCGIEFRSAFACFHNSTADPKGSDCYEKFKTMQSCMEKYPAVYSKETDLNDLEDDDDSEVKHSSRRNIEDDKVHEVKNENSLNVTSSKKEIQQAKTQ